MSRSLIPEIGSRFIPSSSSSLVYRTSQNYERDDSNLSISPANLSLREDTLFNHSSSNVSSGQQISVSSDSESAYTKSPVSHVGSPLDFHQEVVAEALDFDHDTKVLKFDTVPNLRTKKLPFHNRLIGSMGDDLFTDMNKKPPAPVKTIVATDILQAPGLRNDYYSNLVSWSYKTNRVAVGLGSKVYLWGVDNNVTQINYNNEELVTAVSCSNEDWILVATAAGKILLMDQQENSVVAEYTTNEGKCVFCFTWFDNSTMFLAGDDFGEVYIFKITKVFDVEIKLVKIFKCHQQQICGLALNGKNDEVAVGANDNCCTIWNLKDVTDPVLKFVLPHNAAIKALSYCPWTLSLLATGGGSKDRKIRFWHTASGTLLNEYYTDGQITSLIWSRFKKEIVATFGFGGTSKSNLLCVYTYPKMQPILEVNAACNLRILSATILPDSCSICVATNDSTIRIYQLWEKTLEIMPGATQRITGTYGSDIIELLEGISKNGEVIR
ncbi:Meiosis-specific APC/C activator protein AMA1 [Candida viswanathii]|uniref:Meiosis-specific APC/C activator protein AMA1 n=1 Tax=Candida viswanathii TaxID=5486 RepID=A0A367XWI5_9ASCO|nr:Meiosis-specific APC/C activator protein AMA1 [Candida viswanathii]